MPGLSIVDTVAKRGFRSLVQLSEIMGKRNCNIDQSSQIEAWCYQIGILNSGRSEGVTVDIGISPCSPFQTSIYSSDLPHLATICMIQPLPEHWYRIGVVKILGQRGCHVFEIGHCVSYNPFGIFQLFIVRYRLVIIGLPLFQVLMDEGCIITSINHSTSYRQSLSYPVVPPIDWSTESPISDSK